MSLASEILGRRLGLPAPETREIDVERDVSIPMDDGTTLLATRYAPHLPGPRPTILVRSPYGRTGFFGLIYGRLLAERGFQCVVQSVRGTFGSGGDFAPFDERADGLATLAWVERQPWFDGRLATLGTSYLGVTQWAIARDAGDRLGAMALSATASRVHGQAFGGGAISLETALAWTMIIAGQAGGARGAVRMLRGMRRMGSIAGGLPLAGLDEVATGQSLPFFAEWMEHTRPEDDYWAASDCSPGLGEVTAPAQCVGGWSDIFLPWMLEDFVALQDAGRGPQLVVGPWTHMSAGLLGAGARESLGWLRTHLLGDPRLHDEASVRIYVGGAAAGWRELPRWPPPAREEALDLHPGGLLAPARAGTPSGDRFRYDPAEPTPSIGGPGLLASRPVVDNRALEARDDVLVYSSAPLTATVEAIGPVTVELHVRSSRQHFDVFARVCDVDPEGVSRNVCDALERVAPDRHAASSDGSVCVRFALWPTAHRFGVGHRIRLQVAAGAHPRYSRNPGTGENPALATSGVVADQEVLHGPRHPSCVVLPVTVGGL